jgi:hypothetical protein
MKLKSFSPILDGYESEAVLSTEHAASSYGQAVLVLDNGEALGTADAALAQYHVIEATEEELAALSAAGYDLPAAVWGCPKGPCAGDVVEEGGRHD